MENLVSIYIPTKNRGDILRKALESCVNQTYRKLEIVIVDDGSTDQTEEVVKSFQSLEVPLIYLKNEISKGAPFSRNRAILECSGKFITGLDDDDLFLPERIESFIENWNDQYSFLCANTIIQTNNRQILNVSQGHIDLQSILFENKVLNQVFSLKERFLAVDSFDESLLACQDYDLWIRMIKKFGDAYKIPKVTYIINEDIANNRITKSQKAFVGYFDCYNKHRSIMTPRQRVNRIVHIRLNQRKPTRKKFFLVVKYTGLLNALRFLVKEDFKMLYLFVMKLKTFIKVRKS